MSETLNENLRGPTMDIFPKPLFEIANGSGCRIVDTEGNSYLDMSSGIGVTGLGHCHERIIRAVADQMVQYAHVSNLIAQSPQRKLAEKLCFASGMERILFVNSGTEATEGAMKLARKWGKDRDKKELVGFTGAFHGRSLGAISLLDHPKYTEPFEPLLPATRALPFNDCKALDDLNTETAAVFLEYVQGEGGLTSATSAFSRKLEKKRAELGFLIIADEIQSGMGRTGRFLAYQHFDADPDIVLMAKAIGGGLPLGAFLAKGEAAKTLAPGDHGTTFGGNAVCCAAGSAFMDVMEDLGLIRKAALMGTYLRSKLEVLKAEHANMILEIRGKGLMCGIALFCQAKPIVDRMLEKRVIANATAGNVIRLLPPLIINEEEVDECVEALQSALTDS